MIAIGYSVRLGKAFNNQGNSRPTFCGDLPRHFE
jgi:hypothetical protein